MIEGIVGLPGYGKTLFLVKRLIEAKGAGRTVYANFSSRKGRWDRLGWKSLIDHEDCVIGIDEAHMWFPARGYQNTTQNELGYFQQHRKAGVDLLWTAQNVARVDVALRELTAFFWKVDKLGDYIVARRYDDINFTSASKRIIFSAERYYPEYWTVERVLSRDEQSDMAIVGVRPSHARLEYWDGSSVFLEVANHEELELQGIVKVERFYKDIFGDYVLLDSRDGSGRA